MLKSIFVKKIKIIFSCLIVFIILNDIIHFIIETNKKHISDESSKSEEISKCKYQKGGPRILCAIFTHREVHNTTLLPVSLKDMCKKKVLEGFY